MSVLRQAVCVCIAGALAACGDGSGEPRRPHGIVLLVLDTLRADGLSAYGNPRPTSPHLDRLAAEGVLFENVASNASWTLPGFVGLLSGSLPSKRVYDGGLTRSLVQELRDAGYATAAFTEGGFVSRVFGIDLGFGEYHEVEGPIRLEGVPGREVEGSGGVERTFSDAIAWLRANAERPFFLLVHTYEVHTPYRRRRFAAPLEPGGLGETFEVRDVERLEQGEVAMGPTELAYLRALYDGGVAEADRHAGRLLRALEELGLADRTLVVATSDHGEDMGERDPRLAGDHGRDLYQAVLHVPLLIRDPLHPGPAKRIAAQVRTVDVLPTVLELAGVARPDGVDGRSLVPLMRGAESADRPAYSELQRPNTEVVRTAALREGRHKLVVNSPPLSPGHSVFELYDLEADPDELANLAGERPDLRDRLAARLRERSEAIARRGRARLEAPKEAEAAVRDRLRALGYVE